MRVLVTGAAGFIGYHLCTRLISERIEVYGLDNLNSYYDPQLKHDRLRQLGWQKSDESPGSGDSVSSNFAAVDIADDRQLDAFFDRTQPEIVVHLAAQAGVRYSIEHPEAYVQSNLVGFVNVLERCRHNNVQHLIYASSSSVYGLNTRKPFKVTDSTGHPVSLYAASKRANELMAHTYSHLYGLPTTGLRFFTVYGPWGRPDMAPIKFADRIFRGEAIDVYNYGKMKRDFTYVDDIVEGIMRLLSKPPTSDERWDPVKPDLSVSSAPFTIHNIGRGEPVDLMDFIRAVETAAGRSAELNMLPMQPGDVEETFADTTSLVHATGYKPQVSLSEGVSRFVEWYRHYYRPD